MNIPECRVSNRASDPLSAVLVILDVKTCRQRKSIRLSRRSAPEELALRICLVRRSPPRAGLTLTLNRIGYPLARLDPPGFSSPSGICGLCEIRAVLVCSTTSRQPVLCSHGPRSVSIADMEVTTMMILIVMFAVASTPRPTRSLVVVS